MYRDLLVVSSFCLVYLSVLISVSASVSLCLSVSVPLPLSPPLLPDVQAFTKLGFGFEEKCWCYETVAAVLHLGNISFSANGEGSQVHLVGFFCRVFVTLPVVGTGCLPHKKVVRMCVHGARFTADGHDQVGQSGWSFTKGRIRKSSN